MNIAQKVIVSIFVPILVGIPVLSIEVKRHYQETEYGSTWKPTPLYEYPMAWWGLALCLAVFLMILWRGKKERGMDSSDD